ncbi:TrbC/VirB2 family protein [Blastomonas sp.]|uniref:TrbC/VirB2 family protein n=1 Tax=Blastomonas sp. TaxID=1909299 RepID=UPI003593558C
MIYSEPFSAPSGSGALVSAVEWLQTTLLGTVATTIAVIAVAAIGLGMLSGRVELCKGATVIIGCFIVFGASNIAAGILLAANAGGPAYSQVVPVETAPPPPPPPSPNQPSAYDPYAGAAMPIQ